MQHRKPGQLRRSLIVTVVATVLQGGTGVGPAHAWDARTTEGTAAELANTSTPLPPNGDQCSLFSPDSISGLYEFSWACHAHDVCYQNHQLNGRDRTRVECDEIMVAKMVAECRARHSWRNRKRYVCFAAAERYFWAVRLLGELSWRSWNGDPDDREVGIPG